MNNKGAVLVISLMVTVIVTALSTAFILKTVQEKNAAEIEVRSAKVNYATEAGGNGGLSMLYNLINYYMLNKVNSTDPSVVSSNAATYASSRNGIGLLMTYVRNGSTALLTQNGANEVVYTGTSTAIDNGSCTYTIRINPKGNPTSPGSNVWDFPFFFKIQATGANGSQQMKKTLYGDFTVRVQKDNFARYALFTNTQTTQSGTDVWFTEFTNFSGPIFTNGRYNFAYNPSGTFYDLAKQKETTARFFNNNHPVLLDAAANGTRDVPSFPAGFQRGVTGITMPTSSVESSMSSEAAGGNTYSSNGIYIPTSGTNMSGGIYVNGDATVDLGLDGSDRQVITVVQGSTTKTITIDKATNHTIVKIGSGSPTTYTGLPDGVSDIGPLMYVHGNITSLKGTVQSSTKMTISSQNDIVIKNNLTYETYTPSSGTPGEAGYVAPSAEGADNLLGILSWQGNVRISSTAPSDIQIHATIMAKEGVFSVDNYETINPKGTATILGGVISDNYGAFGTFDSSSGDLVSGYGRNFAYDSRMETAATPPYFPTMNTFIAFTDDIEDKLSWQQGGF
jgi:hypothetical protein